MRWRMAVCSLVFGYVALLTHAPAAQAQPAPPPAAATPAPDWQAANREIVALVRAGRYAEAEARAQAAQALCPPDAAPRVLCLSLLQENTAWAQTRDGRHAQAEANYRAALAQREAAFAANDPAIGDSLASLGFFYFDRQRWEETATQMERAAEILAAAGPDRTPVLGAVYARLIDAYRAQGRATAALTTAREAVTTLTRRAGAEAAITQNARASLTSLLADAGQGASAIETALATLRGETLALEQRVRLTIEAVATANTLGQPEAVRAAFETSFSLIAGWADSGDTTQRQGFAQLALAGGELALARGDPDAALGLARQAKAVIIALAGKLDARASHALIQEARALLEQGQAEQAASLLTEAIALDTSAKPAPAQLAWMVRALMDAGRMAEAQARLSEAQAAIAGQPDAQSAFGASLLQLAAQLAERQGNPRAALVAVEQAITFLPEPRIGAANAVQAVNLRRDAIRLRSVLGDMTGTVAALTALLEVQTEARLPLASRLETRLLLGMFHAETRQPDLLRTQIAAVEAALPGLEAQAPRGAAIMLNRLADLALALPGASGAAMAMGFIERARLGLGRNGQSVRDTARGAILRGRILARLERDAEALATCRAAEESLTSITSGAEALARDAWFCVARAALQLGQFGPASTSIAQLLERLPAPRKADRAEAMRLLAAAQTGQREFDAADRTLRDALDSVADLAPRRGGLRAEIWGAISANLHQAGRDREARNAAVAQRQIANEDSAGPVLTMQSLRHEAAALLASQQLDEAITVLDRAERIRDAMQRIDPGELAEHDTVLARLELARGRFTEAALVADRVIAGYRAQTAPPRAGLAAILEVRAGVQLAQGGFIAAETAQREALGLRLAASGAAAKAAADAAWARLGLARILGQRGDATAMAERAAALETLGTAPNVAPAHIALARLEAVPDLRQAGRDAEAVAIIAACETGLAGDADGRIAPCHLARALRALDTKSWAAARDAAMAALTAMRLRGDADRPALVAPLLALATAALAMEDADGARIALDQATPLLDRAVLGERMQGALLQAKLHLRTGAHAPAATQARAGLALLRPSLPKPFATALLGLTEAASAALLAQGEGGEAAVLWRAAITQLDGWQDRSSARIAAQRGLGTALLATPDTEAALQAWQWAEQREASTRDGGQGAGSTAHLAAITGVVRASLASGRLAQARRAGETLADFSTPGAALRLASLRAEIAEETGDQVSALLEWWRAAELAQEEAGQDAGQDAGEDMGQPTRAALMLLRTARAALATAQRARAEALAEQARQRQPAPPAGSDTALAFLELTALLRAEAGDLPAATAATMAWRDAVLRHRGPGSLAALAPALALAALEQRAGEPAEAAARLSTALGQAERLRGRNSPLWAGIALRAADAAERIHDDARAKLLRGQAGAAPRR